MADLVHEMLDKFMALSQEEKQISADMDAAFKEYNDYCSSSDEDLNKKIDEIHEKMHKLDYLLDYAKEHAQPDGLEEAPAPFETSAGQLESIRQTIKLDSHNDPNAETLYTKVTGQIKFYEQKIEQTKHLIEGSKVQAKRQYDSDVASLTDRKQQHDEKVKQYIQSSDFKEYLKLLVFDKSAFNSPGTSNIPAGSPVSIGQRRVKLSVPMEVENDLSALSNGEYNAASRTIGAPYQVSVTKGGVLYLDYDERNHNYLMGGIQRLLLNIIKYAGQNITDMLFCEPGTFSADSLGHIAALGKGINPFITVPQSISDAEAKLGEFAAAAQSSPTPDKVSRVLVLQGFPENYMDDMLDKAVSLCKTAQQNGVLVVLTHASSADESPVEREVRTLATSVRSRNGAFWIEESRESLYWYSAPSDLPDEIRRVYVEQRRQQAAAHAVQEHAHEPAAVQPAPVAPAAQATRAESAASPAATVAAEPARQAQPVVQHGYDIRPEDDIPEEVRRTEDGEPVPAHILFNLPRPKPEEKEVSLTVVSELSETLSYDPEEEKAPEPVSEPVPERTPEPVREAAPEPVRAVSQPVQEVSRPVQAVPHEEHTIPEHVPAAEPVQSAPAPRPERPAQPAPAPVQAAQPAPAPVQSAPAPKPAEQPVRAEAPAAAEVRKPETPKPSKSKKGVRKMPEIKIGMTVDSKPVNFDLGGVTYICGSRGGDREALTDRVITQIISGTHPDDAELWLFDCGGGELLKYSAKAAPHIKYDVSDHNGDTAIDMIDVISAEMEKRIIAFNKNDWADYSAVPANVYMPRIFVVVNEFSKLLESVGSAPRYFGRNYTLKLAKLFGQGGNYGIHFLLTAEAFFENGKRPECLENCAIHCAAAVAGCDSGVKEMFGHIKLYENEIESLKRVPEGCAFTAVEGSGEGLTMVRIMTAHQPLDMNFTVVSEYTDNDRKYVNKHPLLADRKLRVSREDRSVVRKELIDAKYDGETLLFLGEPCRFRAEYPVKLYEEFGENLLVIAPEREKDGAVQMIASALRSLEEQGIAAEVLAWRSNPIYRELSNSGALEGVRVLESDEAVNRVKEISADIDGGKRTEVFEIVLGGDLLLAAMHADDCIGNLKRSLVKGSRMGVHFMFVSGSVAQLAAGFISLFRHKLVFACPHTDAEKILRDTSCALPENAFRLSNDYDELTMQPYSI